MSGSGLVTEPGYVLHARAWRETSLLLECLTPDHGRLGVVARGAHRRSGRFSAGDLQPFQPLLLTFAKRGELASLRAAELSDRAPVLVGNALLAGLYVNELIVRLSAREDPYGGLFGIYATVLQRLADREQNLAWTLRRFERDLLAALGYAVEMDADADNRGVLVPTAWYRYMPEQGPVSTTADDAQAVLGSDLMALRDDALPVDRACMRRLRQLLQNLLNYYLGGRGLKSWQVLRAAPGRAMPPTLPRAKPENR